MIPENLFIKYLLEGCSLGMSHRENLISDLTDLKNTLLKIENLESKKEQVYVKRNNHEERNKKTLRKKYIIFIIVLFILEDLINKIFAVISNLIYAITGGIFGITAVDMFSVLSFSIWVLFFYFLYKIVFISSESKKRFLVINQKEYEPTISSIDSNLDKLLKEINSFQKIVSHVYWDSKTITALISYLTVGRADSIKEALNLFEEEQRYLQLENKNRQLQRSFESIRVENAMAQNKLNSKLNSLQNHTRTVEDKVNNIKNRRY